MTDDAMRRIAELETQLADTVDKLTYYKEAFFALAEKLPTYVTKAQHESVVDAVKADYSTLLKQRTDERARCDKALAALKARVAELEKFPGYAKFRERTLAEGADAERAAVVMWLRTEAAGAAAGLDFCTLTGPASSIESGAHLRDSKQVSATNDDCWFAKREGYPCDLSHEDKAQLCKSCRAVASSRTEGDSDEY